MTAATKSRLYFSPWSSPVLHSYWEWTESRIVVQKQHIDFERYAWAIEFVFGTIPNNEKYFLTHHINYKGRDVWFTYHEVFIGDVEKEEGVSHSYSDYGHQYVTSMRFNKLMNTLRRIKAKIDSL